MTEKHGFELVESRHIAEINSDAKLYRHIRTGAELLSLENDDENKSFMVSFVTPPSDDTGIAHILEHSVLGGSHKYPLKEPFVELLKTSVNTFLNAMTSSDMTMYPIASTNLQDFYNLLDVYLDATFFPLITEQTLMQEGWHLETEDENEDGRLIYKGVVFNEMKAAYSTPDYYLNLVTDRALWTQTPYRYSSGGFPASIPDLTYQQFKQFHETYYHPANARFVFSGDDDPETRLRLVNEVINQFEPKTVDAEIPLQIPFSEPRTVVEGYDASDQNGNGKMVSVNWLLPDQNDLKTLNQLSLLAHALVATSASPLRKALIDSGLGEGLTGSGLGTSSRQTTFSVGLKGVKEADAQTVSDFIIETLGKIAEDGIDKETVKASLNTIEFSMRERNYGSFPRGLANAMIAMRPWIYGGNPLDTLAFESELAELKQQLAEDDNLLENLIGQYLLDNPHRVTVILKPDETVAPAREQAERDRLDKTRGAMNTDDIKQVLSIQRDLLTRQQTPDTPEDLAKIPTLTLSDIAREITTVDQEIIEQDGARIYFHDQPTGGIIYLQMGLNLRVLPPELLPYVELFGEALTRMGTATQDFVRLTQRIGSQTGGLGAGTSLSMRRDGSDYIAYLMLSGKTLTAQSQELLDIVRDIVLTVNLDDRERFKQIVLERKVRMERYLAFAGHAVAAGRVRAQFTEPDWANQQMSGTDHVFFLRELIERIDSDWDSVRGALEAVKLALVNRAQMVVNVTMEGKDWSSFKPQLDSLLSALPAQDVSLATWQTADTIPYEALTQPAQVSFNALVADIHALGYQPDGSVSVIMKHMSREYMWQKIRVMGGAYGGNMSYSVSTGLVSYLSWRDPNISKTLTNFKGASNYLLDLQMSEDALEKAIIGAVGDLDSYELPDAKGRHAFMRHLLGYSDAMRQTYRNQVLGTTLADFHQLGAILAQIGDSGRFATVTAPEFVQRAGEELGVEFQTTKLQ
ncbi:MAG: insulinase family protein [Anaerolineae bacterium]